MRRCFVVVVLAVVAGCAQRPHGEGPPCSTAGQRFLLMSAERLGDAGIADADALSAEIVRERDVVVSACERDGWPVSVRACMGAAADRAAFAACTERLTEAQRQSLERARRPR